MEPLLHAANPPAGLPPLRIHHFLAWTTVLAAAFTLFTLLDRPRTLNREEPWSIVSTIVTEVIQNAAITGLGFGFAWRRQGLSFPSDPGQWMIVQSGLEGMVALLLSVVLVVIHPGVHPEEIVPLAPEWFQLLWRLAHIALAAALLVMNVLVATRLVHGWRWRLVFAVTAWIWAWSLAFQFAFGLFPSFFDTVNIFAMLRYASLFAFGVPMVLLLFLISLAAVHDWRRGVARHWSHWLGVCVSCIELLRNALTFAAGYW
jgi:hypothetical protein